MMWLVSFALAGQNAAATAEYARQVTTANLRAAQIEQQLVKASARIEQLEEFVRMQGRTEAAKLENFDQVNTEVTRLRGEIEVLTHGLEQLQLDLTTYQVSQERRQLHDENRLNQVEDFLGIRPPPPPTAADLGVADPGVPPLDPDRPGVEELMHDSTTPPSTPPTARGKLDAAIEHMAADRQAVARAVLLKAREAHPGSTEIPEINYRIAETHLNQKDYGKAALAFKGVIDNHPTSQWAPWAMLRQGECFAGLGQRDNARLFFNGVTQRYPKSEAAKEAKKRLTE